VYSPEELLIIQLLAFIILYAWRTLDMLLLYYAVDFFNPVFINHQNVFCFLVPPPPPRPTRIFAKPTHRTAQWVYECTCRIGRWPQLIWPHPGASRGENWNEKERDHIPYWHLEASIIHTSENATPYTEPRWTEILDASDHNDNDDVTFLTYLYNVLHRSWHKESTSSYLSLSFLSPTLFSIPISSALQ
jgi:hypothetical protein